jgi:hypothetical protein
MVNQYNKLTEGADNKKKLPYFPMDPEKMGNHYEMKKQRDILTGGYGLTIVPASRK